MLKAPTDGSLRHLSAVTIESKFSPRQLQSHNRIISLKEEKGLYSGTEKFVSSSDIIERPRVAPCEVGSGRTRDTQQKILDAKFDSNIVRMVGEDHDERHIYQTRKCHDSYKERTTGRTISGKDMTRERPFPNENDDNLLSPPMLECWDGRRQEKEEHFAEDSCRQGTDEYSFVASSTERLVESETPVVKSRYRKASEKVSLRSRYRTGSCARAHSEGARPRRHIIATLRRDEAGTEKVPGANSEGSEDVKEAETLSASTAISTGIAQELSISSLPPMGITKTAANLHCGETSFGDSSASAPFARWASRNDSNCRDGSGCGLGGVCTARRRRVGPTRWKRRGSTDATIRLRCEGPDAGR